MLAQRMKDKNLDYVDFHGYTVREDGMDITPFAFSLELAKKNIGA